jgi:hypothetical protein
MGILTVLSRFTRSLFTWCSQTIDVDTTDSKTPINVHVIGPLRYAKASDVASTIKELYREHSQ